jgi:hypothetical protein
MNVNLATLVVVKVHTRLERRQRGLCAAIKIPKIRLLQPKL